MQDYTGMHGQQNRKFKISIVNHVRLFWVYIIKKKSLFPLTEGQTERERERERERKLNVEVKKK